MKAILKSKPAHGIEFVTQFPEPEVGADEVLIKVAATSICGTDLHLFEWTKSAQAFNPKLPIIMGHECSGTVVAVGPSVKNVKPGDRVAAESHIFCGACYPCRTGDAHNCLNMELLGLTWHGAFAEYAKFPSQVMFPLPESVPLDLGALFEPCGVAVHALQRAGSVAGCTVMVTGCGPIGLVIIQLSLLGGATKVIGVEPNPYRRKLAEKLGAIVVDPRTQDAVAVARQHSARRSGIDVAFEASAVESVIPQLFAAVRREGTIVLIGHPSNPVPIDLARDINKSGIILKGIFGRRIWETWEDLLAYVDSGRLDLSKLVTHRLGIDEFEQGMKLLTGESAKVLIYPN